VARGSSFAAARPVGSSEPKKERKKMLHKLPSRYQIRASFENSGIHTNGSISRQVCGQNMEELRISAPQYRG